MAMGNTLLDKYRRNIKIVPQRLIYLETILHHMSIKIKTIKNSNEGYSKFVGETHLFIQPFHARSQAMLFEMFINKSNLIHVILKPVLLQENLT